jgi:uncharacterized membrane protein YcaP (DUF421 family)
METVIRVAAIYLFLMVGLRIIGKREFSQLSALELVSLLLIPEMVSSALQREAASLTNGFIGIATLFGLVFVTSTLMHLNNKVAHVVGGNPVVLVYRGHLVPDHINRERIPTGEIFDAMFLAGVDDLKQVKWAILDPDGKIAIVPEGAGSSSVGNQAMKESESAANR